MARSAGDCAAILNVIAGSDLDEPVPNYIANIEGGIRGVRLGVDFSYAGEDSDDDVVCALSEAQRILGPVDIH
jgi:amidase